jgi:hypothetical protein
MADIKISGSTKAKAVDPLAGQFGGDSSAYAADAAEVTVSEDSLLVLRTMAEELINAERAVAAAENELKKKIAQLHDIQEVRLPNLMERVGLPKFEFLDRTTGLTLIIKFESDKWRVTLPPLKDKQGNLQPDGEEKRAKIMAWLRSVNLGGIIDKDMEVPLGLEDDTRVAEIVTAFKTAFPDLDPAVKEGVNQKRLQSQVSRLLKAGKSVHEDLVVQPIRKATVNAKK